MSFADIMRDPDVIACFAAAPAFAGTQAELRYEVGRASRDEFTEARRRTLLDDLRKIANRDAVILNRIAAQYRNAPQ